MSSVFQLIVAYCNAKRRTGETFTVKLVHMYL